MKRFLLIFLALPFFATAMDKSTPQFEGPIKNSFNNRYNVYAKINGKEIGHITFNECTYEPCTWEIIDLEVNKDLRKQGVARELFKYCIKCARANNAQVLVWKAQSNDMKIDNKKIVKIYKKIIKRLKVPAVLTVGAPQGPYGLESTQMKLSFR
jgi:GNAT superfamily N-acetyltransferase